MSSKARKKFQQSMLPEVTKLVESHKALSAMMGLGKRHLNHITQSGVLMLCASWELYVEELAVEEAGHLFKRAKSPGCLPNLVQKTIVNALNNDKHELKPLELAGEGWKKVYKDNLDKKIEKFNSPKPTNINELYKNHLGWESPSDVWGVKPEYIIKFVELRGDITHGNFGGKKLDYVQIKELRNYISTISKTVDEQDNAANNYIFETTKYEMRFKRPWRRIIK